MRLAHSDIAILCESQKIENHKIIYISHIYFAFRQASVHAIYRCLEIVNVNGPHLFNILIFYFLKKIWLIQGPQLHSS